LKTALLIQALLWALAGEEPPPACPTRDAVAQALTPVLIPSQQPAAPGDLPPGVQVVDTGDTFEVTAGGQKQRYNDPAHDCAERARVAAVFIALALNPPMLPPAPPPPPPPVIVSPPPPPPAPPAPRTVLAAGAAGRLDMGAGGGANVARGLAVGGEALFRVERRSIGGLVTAGVLTSTFSTLNGVRVREQRFPVSVSATMRWHVAPHLETVAEAGLSLTPLTLEAEGLSEPNPVTRLDVGPRVGVEARLAARALVAIAALHVEYFPGTRSISVAPLNGIGSVAPLQIGFSLGLEIPVRGQD